MKSVVILLILVVALIVLVSLVFAQRRGVGDLPVVKKPLLTKRERAALVAIEAAFPTCRVYPQVSMNALVQTRKGLDRKQRASVHNRFAQKIVDFVVEDKNDDQIRFLIEVDDRTHDSEKDRQRDAITSAAGYRTIRVPGGVKLDAGTVRALCSTSALPPEKV